MKKNGLFRFVDNYINEKKFCMSYKHNVLDVINYSKILDFSSTLISFEDKEKSYYVEGENLVISKMMEDEILITGSIKRITFI